MQCTTLVQSVAMRTLVPQQKRVDVKDEDLVEGDMALKFASQRHKKKLKLRGEGPYVVSEIAKIGTC